MWGRLLSDIGQNGDYRIGKAREAGQLARGTASLWVGEKAVCPGSVPAWPASGQGGGTNVRARATDPGFGEEDSTPRLLGFAPALAPFSTRLPPECARLVLVSERVR